MKRKQTQSNSATHLINMSAEEVARKKKKKKKSRREGSDSGAAAAAAAAEMRREKQLRRVGGDSDSDDSASAAEASSSGFRSVRAAMHVHLQPRDLGNVAAGVRRHLNRMLLQYSEDLGGVPVCYYPPVSLGGGSTCDGGVDGAGDWGRLAAASTRVEWQHCG